jgi:polyisoprenoid-binding protein YceI
MRTSPLALVAFAAAVSAALLPAAPLAAAPRTYTIAHDGKNVAGFRIDDAVETIDGTTPKLTGTIVADPDDAAASSVDLRVDLSALDTGIGLRDSHIRDEYVETKKFPQATFRSVSVAAPAGTPIVANQPVEVSVTGDFTMHGVTKRITAPVRIVLIPASEITKASRGPGDWIHATASFPLTLSDFGIKVPTSFASDRIDVRLDVFANATR